MIHPTLRAVPTCCRLDRPAGECASGGTGIRTREFKNASTGALLGTVSGADPKKALSPGRNLFFGAPQRQGFPRGQRQVSCFLAATETSSVIFAAPKELRIGAGPAGPNVIEVIATDGTASTTPPFSGTFHSWFLDGESFFSRTGFTVWVYPRISGTVKGIFALLSIQNLTGQGLLLLNA